MLRKLLAIMLFMVTASVKADQIADIDIEMSNEPVQAVGIVVGSGGTFQRANLEWKKPRAGVITVQVPVTSEEQKQGSFVTAMVLDNAGKVYFGPMKAAAQVESLDSINTLPQCPGRKVPAGLETKTGELQLLIDLRAQRRDYSQKKIAGKLNGKLLEKARTLEIGFGLARATPLGPELHPLELSDRLSRLAAAIKNYKRQEAAAANAASASSAAPSPTPKK